MEAANDNKAIDCLIRSKAKLEKQMKANRACCEQLRLTKGNDMKIQKSLVRINNSYQKMIELYAKVQHRLAQH